ncbi:hypothetical protein ACINLE_19045 [Bacillus sp. z60-18]|uniref:hypothetical protein n=1 Tax=unclassified Bacillus (in: firmicutes) TaxID=185979 RepID=UPI00240A0A74|nr:hypothetical protein [Bacillus sp. HSf4]WFA07114.1 hypothetical protein P3X63_10270 [Bacillus sp. HSf4]
MKKRTKIFYCNAALALLVLAGCTGGTKEAKTAHSNNDSVLESQEAPSEKQDSNSTDKKENESVAKKGSEESAIDDSKDKETKTREPKHPSKSEKDDALSGYSAEEIEYARVWLQLGPNQELDELNVRHISAGEPINPNDDTSARYPEDVIQLAGSRLVDGSVTYSGNGDGTIKVYNVPLRWDRSADVDKNFMHEYTKGIIENKKLVHVDPGDDVKVIKLIDIMNIH